MARAVMCLSSELFAELFGDVIDDDRPRGPGLAVVALDPDQGAGIVSIGAVVDANRGEFPIGWAVVDAVRFGLRQDEGQSAEPD
jgi:hypothetical protein